MKPAIFMDRDGTIIREANFLSDIDDLKILPGVASALKKLRQAGYLRFVVTNQSGIARGYFDVETVDYLHSEIRRRLKSRGADIEKFYICPHHPDHPGSGKECGCRKPSPGMIEAALGEWPIDLARSWVVGDKVADVELARNVGCKAALVLTGYGKEAEAELKQNGAPPDLVSINFSAAVEEILNRES